MHENLEDMSAKYIENQMSFLEYWPLIGCYKPWITYLTCKIRGFFYEYYNSIIVLVAMPAYQKSDILVNLVEIILIPEVHQEI